VLADAELRAQGMEALRKEMEAEAEAPGQAQAAAGETAQGDVAARLARLDAQQARMDAELERMRVCARARCRRWACTRRIAIRLGMIRVVRVLAWSGWS